MLFVGNKIIYSMRIDFSRLEKDNTLSSHAFRTLPHHILMAQSHSQPQIIKKNSIPSQNASDEYIKIQVNYPYNITKSFSPDRYDREIQYLKAKNILPQSTLKFIEREVIKEVEKIEGANIHAEKSKEDNAKANAHKNIPYWYDMMMSKTNRNQKPFKKIKNNQQKLMQMQINSKHMHINPKVKQMKHPNALKTSKHHNNRTSQSIELSSQAKKSLAQLQETTFTPNLNYTMNCHITKKTIQNRKHHRKTSVYETLYAHAQVIQTKRSLQKIILEQSISTERQSGSQLTKKLNKNRKFDPFYKRLEKSLQKQAKKRMLNQTYYQIDHQSGQKLFTPNTIASKLTYQTLFKPTLKQSTIEQEYPIKEINYFQTSTQKSYDIDASTTVKLKASSSLQKSGDYSMTIPLNHSKQTTIHDKIIQRYVQLFYSDENTEFNRDYNSLAGLSQMQYKILDPFLTSIQQFQQSQKVSKHAFRVLFKNYYKKLTFYDKLFLRENLQMQNKSKKLMKKVKEEQPVRPHKKSIKVMNLSRSTEKLDHVYDQSLYYV